MTIGKAELNRTRNVLLVPMMETDITLPRLLNNNSSMNHHSTIDDRSKSVINQRVVCERAQRR